MIKNNEIGDFVYRAVTHALLGVLAFLGIKIFNDLEDIKKSITAHEIRLSIVEEKIGLPKAPLQ